MTREEQKTNAAKEMYPAGTQNSLQFRVGFATGVEWADEHPKEGLWDAEKVTEWLEKYVREFKYYDNDFADGNIDVDNLIETLTKAMEE